MDDKACLDFFLQPTDTLHRRYEALRAYFVEHRPVSEIATRFGLSSSTMCSAIRDFRSQCRNGGPPPFSPPLASDDPPDGRPS